MEFSFIGRELLETLQDLLKERPCHFTKLYVLFPFPYSSLDKELGKIGLYSYVYNGFTSANYKLYNRSLFLAYIEKEFPRHYMVLVEQEVKDIMEGYRDLCTWKDHKDYHWYISDNSHSLNYRLFNLPTYSITSSLEDMGLIAHIDIPNRVLLVNFDKLLLAVKEYNPVLYYYYCEQQLKDL